MDWKKLPDLLREYMEKTGLSQEKAAHEIGVTLFTIRRWLEGHLPDSDAMKYRIADVLRAAGVIDGEDAPGPDRETLRE